tara:strand:- start:5 stop:235 length:231 start_codon:yes stop_codon:yes gene_type:complete
MSEWDYEGSEQDFGYEVSGATGEEFEHEGECDWIYDNCTCGMADKIEAFKDSQTHVCEDKESCWHCSVVKDMTMEE